MAQNDALCATASRKSILTRTIQNGYASSHDRRVDCGLRSADRRGRRPMLSGSAASGARECQTAMARQEAGGACAVRPGMPGASQMRAAPDPGLSPGWSRPHLTSSGIPRRAFLRFPVCPPGSPPSPAFGWFPAVQRSPVRSLRPLPGSGSPSVSLRIPFPLSNSHVSAAAGRFRRRWPRAAGTTVTSPAAAPRLDRRDPPALQAGSGRARGHAATGSPLMSGRERRTRRARINKAAPGYPLNRSNAGQRCARVSRETGLFQSVTSANVGRSGWHSG